jgi:excinuclease ABC subunit B
MIVTYPNSPYQLFKPFEPAGDQPEAIAGLVEGLKDGLAFQTLLGVTGSGKTYTMANVIAQTGGRRWCSRPTRRSRRSSIRSSASSFPHNSVEYFVSYYDYYQPEAYVPSARSLHREGQLDQRAHRADAAVRDQGDPRAARTS